MSGAEAEAHVVGAAHEHRPLPMGGRLLTLSLAGPRLRCVQIVEHTVHQSHEVKKRGADVPDPTTVAVVAETGSAGTAGNAGNVIAAGYFASYSVVGLFAVVGVLFVAV